MKNKDIISIGSGESFEDDWNERAKILGAIEASSWGPDASIMLSTFLGYVLAERIKFHLKFEKKDVVLDLGCGPGKITKHIINDCNRMVAVDVSDVMLEEAKSQFSEYDNVVTIHNNGEDLHEIDSGCIDKVYSYGMFIHIPENIQKKYIGEIVRVLKPGGSGLIHIRFNQTMKTYKKTYTGTPYTFEKFDQLCQKYKSCNFKLIELRRDEDLSDLKYRRFIKIEKNA